MYNDFRILNKIVIFYFQSCLAVFVKEYGAQLIELCWLILVTFFNGKSVFWIYSQFPL